MQGNKPDSTELSLNVRNKNNGTKGTSYLLNTALVFNNEYHFIIEQNNMDDTIL